MKKWLRHFFIEKPIQGLVFNVQKCDYTFVYWYNKLQTIGWERISHGDISHEVLLLGFCNLIKNPIFWWRGEAAPPKNRFLILQRSPYPT